MKIIKETKQDNTIYFASIEVGQPFKYNNELYIRTDEFFDFEYEKYNAINLRTGDNWLWVNDYDSVTKVKAYVKYEEN